MECQISLKCSQDTSTLPHPEPDQYGARPQIICGRSILILSSHISLDLPKSLFVQELPTRILKAPLHSPIRAT